MTGAGRADPFGYLAALKWQRKLLAGSVISVQDGDDDVMDFSKVSTETVTEEAGASAGAGIAGTQSRSAKDRPSAQPSPQKRKQPKRPLAPNSIKMHG